MVRGRGYVQSIERHREDRRQGDAEDGHAGAACSTSAQVALGPDIRRGVADLDGTATRSAASSSCATARTRSTVIERVQARSSPSSQPTLPRGRRDRHDLRPLGADPARDRHAAARAERGDGHRQPGDPALPLARAVGARSDRHHPRLGAPRVHPDVPDGAHLQHHVARRHRDLDRRAGRRRDRRGRERLQEARAVDRGRPAGRLPRGPAAGAEGGRARRSSSRCS